MLDNSGSDLRRLVGRDKTIVMKTKLLMLLMNRVGRGTYWRALGFAEALILKGYDVTLLAVAPNRKIGFKEYKVSGVNLVETPDLLPSSGYDLWDALNRSAWLGRRKFDIVHAFETRPVNIIPALAACRRDKIPLVTDWCDWFGRGGSVEQRSNWLLRNTLRPLETLFEERFRPSAAGTTVINSILYRKALALGIPAARLLLLPNGANTKDIQPQRKDLVRERLGLSGKSLILGYTGVFFKEDAKLMADAFNLIRAELPQAVLLLIGYANLPIEEMLDDKKSIIRTGPVSFEQLSDYLAACDCGWLPLADCAANRGRFPMKVNDFMAAGRPLIVSDVGDLGFFVDKWNIGFSASPNALSIAQSTIKAFEQQDRLEEIGAHARSVAEDHFSWPIIANKLDHFYKLVRDDIIA